MNVTLSIDEEILARARELAARRRTSVNQMIRNYLEEIVSERSSAEVVEELDQFWSESAGDAGGGRWSARRSMSAAVFLDTNIPVYADDRFDPFRQRRAQELIREVVGRRTGRLSMQVLTEYFAVATRKLGSTRRLHPFL